MTEKSNPLKHADYNDNSLHLSLSLLQKIILKIANGEVEGDMLTKFDCYQKEEKVMLLKSLELKVNFNDELLVNVNELPQFKSSNQQVH